MRNETILSLVVIRSSNIDRAAQFYGALGLQLTKHAHGKSPEHYSAILGDSVLEIYPAQNQQDSTSRTRLGFKVAGLKNIVESVRALGPTIVSELAPTSYGFSAVVQDFDGHKIELYEMS
jgi:lactoylglutathione lyase